MRCYIVSLVAYGPIVPAHVRPHKVFCVITHGIRMYSLN